MENGSSLDQNYALNDFSPTNDKTLDQKVDETADSVASNQKRANTEELEHTSNTFNCDRIYLGPNIHKRLASCTRFDHNMQNHDDIFAITCKNSSENMQTDSEEEWDEIMNTIIEKDLPAFHPGIYIINSDKIEFNQNF